MGRISKIDPKEATRFRVLWAEVGPGGKFRRDDVREKLELGDVIYLCKIGAIEPVGDDVPLVAWEDRTPDSIREQVDAAVAEATAPLVAELEALRAENEALKSAAEKSAKAAEKAGAGGS